MHSNACVCVCAGKENEDPARQSPSDHRDDKTLEENNNHFAASLVAPPAGLGPTVSSSTPHLPLPAEPPLSSPSPSPFPSSTTVCVSTSTSMDACDSINLGEFNNKQQKEKERARISIYQGSHFSERHKLAQHSLTHSLTH